MKGFITKENDYYYVNISTCNGRCGSKEEGCNYDITPEVDDCCLTTKFLLNFESQDKVNIQDQIEFELLNEVLEPINNYIGVYAYYIKHIK